MASTPHTARRRNPLKEARGRAATPLLVLGALFMLAATACYNNNTGQTNIGGDIQFTLPAFPESGAHAVEVFTEMHFSPSYREGEGPRLLPPEDSVPVTGREVAYGSQAEYAELDMPGDFAGSYDAATAQRLYDVNCSVCHGEGLDGQGPIVPLMDLGPFPADLTSSSTRASSDGELFGFITHGGRQGLPLSVLGLETASPMPQFGKLLTEEERWHLVQFLRDR